MTEGKSTLFPLADKQADAVIPDRNIWLSASAGTGKTQVLTARVFRLLLRENVNPEHILCLTFTKAGASEMAERIHRQLATWVRMPQKQLRQDLFAIGAPNDPETQERARTLFAKVLDARGGGLKIMTIHSFCQTLLASFPEEAGVSSMFKPIEERDQKILARDALSDLLVAEEQSGDSNIVSAIQNLSVRMGEEATEQFLMTCASNAQAMEALPDAVEPFIRRLLKLPIEVEPEKWLAEQCSDTKIDRDAMLSLQQAMATHGGKLEQARQQFIAEWLAKSTQDRGATILELHHCWTKKTVEEPPKPTKALLANFPQYDSVCNDLMTWSSDLLAMQTLFEYGNLFAGALNAGRAFHQQYANAKRLQGVVDFDDLIRMTADLLQRSDMSAWIRYKLDQRTDHILVDEAQDTNMAQWDIVDALTDDFFVGKGAHPERLRTVFTVGDFKQAIFGFQGTSPHNYVAAREKFAERAEASERPFQSLSLDRSFRSTPPILEVVDSTLGQLSHNQLGLSEPIPPHRSHYEGTGGSVTLLKPVSHAVRADDEDEETWLDDEKRIFAQRMATQIKQWLSPENPFWLERENRPLEPKDILILVSKRDELSSLIVARLFAENVPVAGMDRLRLDQPLVVQDMLATIRFVLQPKDDLNLASLLVSPIMGWTQEELLQFGYRNTATKDQYLWEYLRGQEALAERIAPLRDLLNMADFNSPYEFLETVLSGPLQARRGLIARLSHSALDPMEELLSTALAFEKDHIPSLQGFLDWFDRGDVEIKRDQVEGGNEVRLMTVHGAKGLQAPMVIMANATFDPSNKRNRGFGLPDPLEPNDNVKYPVVPIRKSERVKLLDAYATVADAREMEEHWRLLYVAMTRAEEHLVVSGTLGTRANGEVPENSWYAAVESGLSALGCEEQDNLFWLSEKTYARPSVGVQKSPTKRTSANGNDEANMALPDWLYQPAPEEARPPRPLTPSDLGPDNVTDPPPSKSMQAAAERGKILHSLFQRLPNIADDQRADIADLWLLKQKAIVDEVQRTELIDTALGVIGNEGWSEIFSPDSLAEAPIVAVVGENVISGTVDRLLITDEVIKVVDFKTGRKVPDSIADVPVAYLRQMAAYVAALEKIFPNRTIKAALLYSHAPKLFAIPDEILERHKPGYERV